MYRLSISPRFQPRGGTPAGGRRGTPLRATKKRRFEEEIESAAEYDTNAVVLGDVEVLEDSPDGKFIRLRNNGDKVNFYNYFLKSIFSRLSIPCLLNLIT